MKTDHWSAAKSLQRDIRSRWTGDFEVYFPAPGEAGPKPQCLITAGLGLAMDHSWQLERFVLGTLARYRLPLQGYSVRVQDGKLALLEGETGAALHPWLLLGD